MRCGQRRDRPTDLMLINILLRSVTRPYQSTKSSHCVPCVAWSNTTLYYINTNGNQHITTHHNAPQRHTTPHNAPQHITTHHDAPRRTTTPHPGGLQLTFLTLMSVIMMGFATAFHHLFHDMEA